MEDREWTAYRWKYRNISVLHVWNQLREVWIVREAWKFNLSIIKKNLSKRNCELLRVDFSHSIWKKGENRGLSRCPPFWIFKRESNEWITFDIQVFSSPLGWYQNVQFPACSISKCSVGRYSRVYVWVEDWVECIISSSSLYSRTFLTSPFWTKFPLCHSLLYPYFLAIPTNP